jgi:hypothetical protein
MTDNPAFKPDGMRMFMWPWCFLISDVVDHAPGCGNGLEVYFPECQSLTKEEGVGGSGDM